MMSAWHQGPSRIHGQGAFASRLIRANEMIGPAQILHERWELTPLGAIHNHSPMPNARSLRVWHPLRSTAHAVSFEVLSRYLVARRDILPGEEITVDYRLQPELEQPQPGWV